MAQTHRADQCVLGCMVEMASPLDGVLSGYNTESLTVDQMGEVTGDEGGHVLPSPTFV